MTLESRRSSIQAEAIAGDALWIGGGLIAVTGLILAFALPDDQPAGSTAPSTPATPPVTAGCSATGCSASVTVSF